MQVLCSLKFTNFGSSWWQSSTGLRLNSGENQPNPPLMAACRWWGGAGVGPPAEPVKPPTEAPEALRPHLDLLTKPLALILVAKQIPWVVQAKLAQEGYVTVEDLGDRWTPRNTHGVKGPEIWSSKMVRTTSIRPPPGSLPCVCFRRSGRPG